MILDIIILAIIVLSIVFGYRAGFVITLANTIGWIGSFIAAQFLQPHVKTFILEHTALYEKLQGSFVTKGQGNISGIESNLTIFPEKMRDVIGGIIKQGADGGSHIMANALVVVIAFVISVVLVKLLLFIFVRLFSKRYRSNAVSGITDTVLGAVIGALKGIVISLVFALVLVPIAVMSGGGLQSWVLTQLNDSYIAAMLYNNNLLLGLWSEKFIR